MLVAAVGIALLLGSCADAVAGTPPVVPSATVTATHGERSGGELQKPPPFEVRYDDEALVLHPYAFCYENGCVDGFDDDPPPVGSPGEIFVHVPVDGFDELTVTQYAGSDDEGCEGRFIESDVEPLGEGWWKVTPRGPAGDYRVSLFASGDGVGDMAADVRWTTPSSSPLPDVEASLALIADIDGEPDSYGLELDVSNLPSTPEDAAATITVTVRDGASMVIEAVRANECVSEGTLRFDGPDGQAKQAAALGGFPFTMRVELVLDGVTHVATATYPDDEIEDIAPSVRLQFTPPLS
jgi:hypothetical protein